MATKRPLPVESLQALGTKRLAEMLIDLAEADPAVERRLRIERATLTSPSDATLEIGKNLSRIARGRAFADRRGAKKLTDDLDAQRDAIAASLAPPRFPSGA